MKQKASDRKKKSKALKDRIHQHLADRNDVITEDDIKNIKVGEETFEDEPETKEALMQDLREEDEIAEAAEQKKIVSPWSILSEDDE